MVDKGIFNVLCDVDFEIVIRGTNAWPYMWSISARSGDGIWCFVSVKHHSKFGTAGNIHLDLIDISPSSGLPFPLLVKRLLNVSLRVVDSEAVCEGAGRGLLSGSGVGVGGAGRGF